MTLGRYWAGGEDEALRAVVEAVKLVIIGSDGLGPAGCTPKAPEEAAVGCPRVRPATVRLSKPVGQ